MVNYERPFEALAVSSNRKEQQPLGDSGLPLSEGRETRGMRNNNNNRHPRSEAR